MGIRSTQTNQFTGMGEFSSGKRQVWEKRDKFIRDSVAQMREIGYCTVFTAEQADEVGKRYGKPIEVRPGDGHIYLRRKG